MANTIQSSIASPAAQINGPSPSPSPAPVLADANVKQNQNPKKAPGEKRPNAHQIYTLPVPIRTFPLPAFFPSNPLSLFHVIYAWISQAVAPPAREPSVVHQGIWSSESRSVHVVNPQSIRALWEQGFFGKGIYSRSEPNWLKREQTRRGQNAGHVAENFTAQRRRERNQMKWERARKEQESIERTRLEEAWVAPVGPMELLALPNSNREIEMLNGATELPIPDDNMSNGEPTGPLDLRTNGTVHEPQNLIIPNGGTRPGLAMPLQGGGSTLSPKRQKSVRFSPKVSSTTFELSDPPSPGVVLSSNSKIIEEPRANGRPPSSPSMAACVLKDATAAIEPKSSTPPTEPVVGPKPTTPQGIVDIEHLQLSPEEALYLTFALGSLSVIEPNTGRPISPKDLFTLFRRNSYFPPAPFFSTSFPSPPATPPLPLQSPLQPDDPFVLQYVAYHHFRSLGWTVRSGIKFGVDWLLYNRGPVFSHAEFAVLVLPAYTHPWWQTANNRTRTNTNAAAATKMQREPRKSWHWLHCANRVQAKALKTLVLLYVDVPPPRSALKNQELDGVDDDDDDDEEEDIAAVLGRYKVREFMVKRWLSNRNRD